MNSPPRTMTSAMVLALALLLHGLAAAEPGRQTWRGDTSARIPRAVAAPVVDGIIDDAEWAGAWSYDGVLNPVTMNLFPRSVRWFLSWDDGHLYLGCSSRVRAGEKPLDELSEEDLAFGDLQRTDAIEVWLSQPGAKPVLHVGVSAKGRTCSELANAPRETRPGPVRAAAQVHDDRLEWELQIPTEVFGRARDNQSGDTWQILLTRNFQAGGALRTLLPNGTGQRIQDAGRQPLFTLTAQLPVACFANPVVGLYAGRAVAEVRIVNPARSAARISASLQIRDASAERYSSRQTLDVPAGQTQTLTFDEPTAPDIDPVLEAEYRYALTIDDESGVLLQTHFVYDPTDSREWLGETLPEGARSGERTLLVDPSRGGIPFKLQRHCEPYTELPEGHKIRLIVRHLWEPSKRHFYDSVQQTVAIDAEGQKEGIERFYDLYGNSLLRTQSWRHGVRHGPEEIMAVEDRKRFARSVTPWENGVVHGLKRVYHANGQVMTEVAYVNGQATGRATSYDREGRIIQIADYADGSRHGLMTDYWPRLPKRIVPYEHGLINGIVHEFYQNGQPKRDRPFRDDILHGIEKVYDETGKLIETRYWYDGDAVGEKEYLDKIQPHQGP